MNAKIHFAPTFCGLFFFFFLDKPLPRLRVAVGEKQGWGILLLHFGAILKYLLSSQFGPLTS